MIKEITVGAKINIQKHPDNQYDRIHFEVSATILVDKNDVFGLDEARREGVNFCKAHLNEEIKIMRDKQKGKL